MISRRHLLSLGALGGVAGLFRSQATAAAAPVSTAEGHYANVPVRSLSGWSLPHVKRDGAKEFHLVAEEVEHEFAPGCRAKCWGYNGGTPGPLIEATVGDRVRLLVTNHLPEATSVHWHGIELPSGMDGVAGLSHPAIAPGETYAYEFTLKHSGSHFYHPHADEVMQLGFGLMGMFIVHPQEGELRRIDRDYCLLLANWALHPGTWRPDPSVMTEFNLWTMNSKMFPATKPMVARTGERVRIRIGNLSMHEHPMHLHGVRFHVTGGDGGRWPEAQWLSEVTALVGVGQVRDIEFEAVAGDWAFHCHKGHHTMNAMAHGLPSLVGVDQRGVAQDLRALVPGYMAMGKNGMEEHSKHIGMGMMKGPANTAPMMSGKGPFGALDMGGMFTVLKVRDDLASGDFRDPGWYSPPPGTVARRISTDPDFGSPPRRPG